MNNEHGLTAEFFRMVGIEPNSLLDDLPWEEVKDDNRRRVNNMKRYFIVLDEDGTSLHGGYAVTWSLPTHNDDGTWTPGDWMPRAEGELSLYGDGYKVGTLDQIINWLGPRIFEVEVGNEIIHDKKKSIARTCRLLREYTNWNERNARLFACDCAERVLDIFERAFSDDDRPRKAIQTARCYANDNATHEELKAIQEEMEHLERCIDSYTPHVFAGYVDAIWSVVKAASKTTVIEEHKNLVYAAITSVALYAVEAIKMTLGDYWASVEAHWQACRLLDILEG